MTEYFDTYGQWFFLNFVYKYEILVIPLLLVVFLLWKNSLLWSPVRIILISFLLFYLLLFRMHWYSYLAWPIFIGILAYDWFRDLWYYLLGLPDRKSSLKPSSETDRSGSAKPAGRKIRRVMAGGAAIAAVGVYLLEVPFDLLLILLVVFLAGWLFIKWTARYREDEKRFNDYVDKDPRLTGYLDWLRWSRSERAHLDGSRLATKRLTSTIPYQTKVFHPGRHPVLKRLARFLSSHQWMPTVRSEYIIQRLEAKREKVWEEYERLKYGLPRDNADQDSAEAYVAACLEAVRENERSDLAIPPELEVENLREMRVKWLNLTEALAECLAFSRPASSPRHKDDPTRWLLASEVLAHAGEVQLEIVLDMERCSDFQTVRQRRSWRKALENEIAMARHFFAQSARCIETWLDPDYERTVSEISPKELWRHFCSNLQGSSRERDDALGEKEMIVGSWRATLANRYWLLELLTQKSGRSTVIHGPQLPRWSLTSMDGSPRGAKHSNPELLLADCARNASEATWWIAIRRGDPSPALSMWGGDEWEDKLAVIEDRLALAGEAPVGPVKSLGVATWSLERFIHLWGLSVEQDLDYLHPLSQVWCDRAELAAVLFNYAGSARSRRIYALMRILLSNLPEEESFLERMDSGEDDLEHSIVELG